jgi:pimeloyl-ACP methyl ester carboxylesterase
MGLFFTEPLFEEFAVGLGLGLGGTVGEVAAICEQIADGDDATWYTVWSAAAERLVDEGEASVARGHQVGAREAYLRASVYHAVSYHPVFGAPVDPRLLAGFDRQAEIFAQAAALADPPGEPLDIQFGNMTLPAYFFQAEDGGKPRPLLIATNGYDATLFEMYLGQGLPALQRGYHCLLFDGPGQGRPLFKDGVAIRPDWENVVTPVVDAALTRPEVDPDRIALTGWSLGGYLALRAATGEHRLAACIADPGLYSIGDGMKGRLQGAGIPAAALQHYPNLDEATLAPVAAAIHGNRAQRWAVEQRGFWVHGVDSLADYIRVIAEFTLEGRVDQISCPTLVCAAEADPLSASARKVFDGLSGPRTFLQFTTEEGAGDHCEMRNRALLNMRVFDWLDETLAGT